MKVGEGNQVTQDPVMQRKEINDQNKLWLVVCLHHSGADRQDRTCCQYGGIGNMAVSFPALIASSAKHIIVVVHESRSRQAGRERNVLQSAHNVQTRGKKIQHMPTDRTEVGEGRERRTKCSSMSAAAAAG